MFWWVNLRVALVRFLCSCVSVRARSNAVLKVSLLLHILCVTGSVLLASLTVWLRLRCCSVSWVSRCRLRVIILRAGF